MYASMNRSSGDQGRGLTSSMTDDVKLSLEAVGIIAALILLSEVVRCLVAKSGD